MRKETKNEGSELETVTGRGQGSFMTLFMFWDCFMAHIIPGQIRPCKNNLHDMINSLLIYSAQL